MPRPHPNIILGELRHHLRDLTWGIRPSRRLQDSSRAALWAELGRRPTVAELAAKLNCDEEMAIEALTALACRSLDSLERLTLNARP
jgi:DNA-directed RNA polymerase specialized sigma subunit